MAVVIVSAHDSVSCGSGEMASGASGGEFGLAVIGSPANRPRRGQIFGRPN